MAVPTTRVPSGLSCEGTAVIPLYHLGHTKLLYGFYNDLESSRFIGATAWCMRYKREDISPSKRQEIMFSQVANIESLGILAFFIHFLNENHGDMCSQNL